jgi:hypothetical protein
LAVRPQVISGASAASLSKCWKSFLRIRTRNQSTLLLLFLNMCAYFSTCAMCFSKRVSLRGMQNGKRSKSFQEDVGMSFAAALRSSLQKGNLRRIFFLWYEFSFCFHVLYSKIFIQPIFGPNRALPSAFASWCSSLQR